MESFKWSGAWGAFSICICLHQKCIEHQIKRASIDAIELYRHQLLNNQKEISILDFGAGADSHGNKSKNHCANC